MSYFISALEKVKPATRKGLGRVEPLAEDYEYVR
jgi:hypothetical protein